jgi:hypothetical protein
VTNIEQIILTVLRDHGELTVADIRAKAAAWPARSVRGDEVTVVLHTLVTRNDVERRAIVDEPTEGHLGDWSYWLSEYGRARLSGLEQASAST